MAKPFKFRYVNEIAGTFAAAMALVLVLAIVFAGRAQKWFEPVTPIAILLPMDGAHGLKHGDDVRILGVSVGVVDQISLPDEQTERMTMVVNVNPRFARFIRSGAQQGGSVDESTASKAIIRVPIGIGDPFVEITRGQGPLLAQGAVLPSELEISTADSINQTINDVRNKTLPEVEGLLKQYSQLAADLQNQQGPFVKTLVHLDRLSENLDRTDTVVGRITSDREFADKLDKAVTNLAASSDQIHQVLGNLQETTTKLPGVMTSLKQTVDTLPGVMLHTQQALIEVQKLVKAVESLPIIGGGVERTTPPKTLQPSDVEGSP
jgi:ABC-type transporter Mla subunit MlaD